MRTYSEITADAEIKQPFSNGTSAEIWMGAWCYRCKVDAQFQAARSGEGCPLILAAYTGHTPREWTEVGLQDYTCSEFVPEDDGDGGPPVVAPVPVVPGQVDMFGVWADEIAASSRELAVAPC